MGIKTDPVKVKSFVLYPTSKKTYQTSWQTSHSWSAQVRFKVLQEIFNKISKSAPKDHRLWVFNYSRMKPTLLNRYPELCPLCVPLSIWFYLVSSFPFEYKYNPDVNGNSLYVGDSYFRLIKPHPMDILSNGGKANVTSRNFQRWLYNRDLQASYKNIFSYTSEIIEDTKLITRLNSRSVVSKPKPDIFNCIDRSLMFYPDNDFRAITVLYLTDDLFDGYKHPKFKGTFKKCEYFHRLIEKNYLLNLEKEYEGVSPQSGLSLNQLLTLEYGYERFHKEQDLVSTFLSEKH